MERWTDGQGQPGRRKQDGCGGAPPAPDAKEGAEEAAVLPQARGARSAVGARGARGAAGTPRPPQGCCRPCWGWGGQTARGTAVLRDPHGSPWHQAAPLMLGAASPWLLCLWGDMGEGAGVPISWVTQPAAPHPEQQPQTGRSSSRSWDPCCGEAGGRGALLPPCCPSSWRDDPKSQGRSRAQGKRVSGSCCLLCQHGWASPPP